MCVFLVLSEATLPRMLWRALWRRPTCVIGVRSLTFELGPYLERIIQALRARGRVQVLEQDLPHLVEDPFFGDMIRHTNVFAESETWLDASFDFPNSTARFGDLAVAYRHICANVAFTRYFLAHRIHGLRRHLPSAAVLGLDRLDQTYFQFRYGRELGRSALPTGLSWVSNAILTVLTLLFTLGWIISRLKVSPPPAKPFLLASDYIDHWTNTVLWGEVSDKPDDILVVFRSKTAQRECPPDVTGRPQVVATDGWFSIQDGLSALAATMADHLRLFRHAGHFPPDFFRKIIALGYRRMMYRALFNRFHCAYFWGRDDYNPEHAVRSVELRRKNGVSLGIMHGIPSIAAIVHQWRHLDFDIYYVHGRHMVHRYYADRWPETMKVVPIGSFGMSRAELHRLAEGASGTGIACFLSVTFQIAKTVEAIKAIARAFPERIFYVNFKRKDLQEPEFERGMADLFGSGIENLVEHDGRSYDLFFLCDTILSEGSTLAAEAIQFGLRSYVFDFFPEQWKSLPYRDFPGVCVATAEDVIAQLRSDTPFPRQVWAEFIEMNGVIPWDAIRRDMRLPVKEGLLVPLSIPHNQSVQCAQAHP